MKEFSNYPGITFSYPEIKILDMPEDLYVFEEAARTCYRSEEKIKEGSDYELLNKIMRLNHTAMIEFIDDLVVKMKTNRGVTHEMVRMRLCSFAQESTRYVKYDSVDYIVPWWTSLTDLESINTEKKALFIGGCRECGSNYKRRIETGWSPQEARGVLINDVSSWINVKTNMREWLHIFKLRCDSPAHPDMRLLMTGLVTHLIQSSQVIAELVKYVPFIQNDLDWFDDSYHLHYKDRNHFVIVSNEDL